MRGLVGLMTGLANGYYEGDQRRQELERQRQLDQLQIARGAREQALFDREQRQQQAVDAAGQPVVAEPDMAPMAEGAPVQRVVRPATMDDRDVGQPGETAPMVPLQRVGAAGALNPEQAAAAVTAANAPDAVQARQLAAVRQFNPVAATSMETGALQLTKLKREEVDRKFEDGLSQAASGGWDKLMAFTDASGASPAKHRFVPDADGKTGEVVEVLPDGTLKPTGLKYENSNKGVLEAAQTLSQRTPLDAKLKHILAEREANRKELHDQANDEYRQRYLDLYGEKNDNKAITDQARIDARLEARKPLEEKMSGLDSARYKDLNKMREKLREQINKARSEDTWNPESPNHKAMQADLRALDLRAQTLEDKYAGDTPGNADPFPGQVRPAPARTPAPIGATGPGKRVVSPGQQAANDKDRPLLLATEYHDPQTAPADREAVLRQIDRLPAAEAARARELIKNPPNVITDDGQTKPLAAPAAVAAVAPAVASQTQRIDAAAPPAVVPQPTSVPAVKVKPPTIVSPVEIPPPPREQRMVNGVLKPNPDYATWRQQYGAAWDAKIQQEQAAADAARAAAFTRVQASRPFMQNRAPS